MPKAGSMRDRAARAAAGHQSASEDVDVDVDVDVEVQERSPKGRARKTETSRKPGRKVTSVEDRDRAVLVGGDDDGDMDADADTGTVEEDRRRAAKKPRKDRKTDEVFFEYRGKRFASEEDLEDYIADLEDDRRVRQAAPLPVQPAAAPPARQQGEDKKVPWDKLIEDTEGTMTAFGDALVQRIRDELIPAYQADRDMHDFWNTFYQENPALSKPKLKMLVQTIFMSNQDKLGPLPLDRARARLARIVKGELRDLGIPLEGAGGYIEEEEEDRSTQQRRRSRTLVEGADDGSRSQRRERRTEDDTPRQPNGNPVTLSTVLKARKARRRGEDTGSFFG